MQNRQVNMLKAAMPYTAPRLRKPMQILIQAQELALYMQKDEEEEIKACNLDTVGDVEGMMESVREYCNEPEKETVNMVLNFIRAQNLYRSYRNYMSTYKNNSENGMFDFLMSQLSSEQQDMVNQMSHMSNAGQGEAV